MFCLRRSRLSVGDHVMANGTQGLCPELIGMYVPSAKFDPIEMLFLLVRYCRSLERFQRKGKY